jgi:hypothetical protein
VIEILKDTDPEFKRVVIFSDREHIDGMYELVLG